MTALEYLKVVVSKRPAHNQPLIWNRPLPAPRAPPASLCSVRHTTHCPAVGWQTNKHVKDNIEDSTLFN